MTRVLLVDDESMTREILRDYLSQDPAIEVVGEASDGRIAVQQAATLQPDLILMDMQMPVMNGVAATERIHAEHPGIAILGLSTFLDGWLAALIVTLVLFAIAGVAALAGKKKVQQAPPPVEATKRNVARDIAAVKEARS